MAETYPMREVTFSAHVLSQMHLSKLKMLYFVPTVHLVGTVFGNEVSCLVIGNCYTYTNRLSRSGTTLFTTSECRNSSMTSFPERYIMFLSFLMCLAHIAGNRRTIFDGIPWLLPPVRFVRPACTHLEPWKHNTWY